MMFQEGNKCHSKREKEEERGGGGGGGGGGEKPPATKKVQLPLVVVSFYSHTAAVNTHICMLAQYARRNE